MEEQKETSKVNTEEIEQSMSGEESEESESEERRREIVRFDSMFLGGFQENIDQQNTREFTNVNTNYNNLANPSDANLISSNNQLNFTNYIVTIPTNTEHRAIEEKDLKLEHEKNLNTSNHSVHSVKNPLNNERNQSRNNESHSKLNPNNQSHISNMTNASHMLQKSFEKNFLRGFNYNINNSRSKNNSHFINPNQSSNDNRKNIEKEKQNERYNLDKSNYSHYLKPKNDNNLEISKISNHDHGRNQKKYKSYKPNAPVGPILNKKNKLEEEKSHGVLKDQGRLSPIANMGTGHHVQFVSENFTHTKDDNKDTLDHNHLVYKSNNDQLPNEKPQILEQNPENVIQVNTPEFEVNNEINISHSNMNQEKSNKSSLQIDEGNKSHTSNIRTHRSNKVNENNPLNNVSQNQTLNQVRKTAFTKISEEAYKKMLENNSRKFSFYNEMISDQYLKKVTEKNTTEGKSKFWDFLERTKEHINKKNINTIAKETIRSLSRFSEPYRESKRNIRVRTPVQYMEDQLRFVERKEMALQAIRDGIKDQTDHVLRTRPNMSQKSQLLAQKSRDTSLDIHERLHKENLHKIKSHVIEEDLRTNSSSFSKNKKTLSEREIKLLVDKLYRDAEIRDSRNSENLKLHRLVKVKSDFGINSPFSSKGFNNSSKLSRNTKSLSQSQSQRARLLSREEDIYIPVEDYDFANKSSKILMIRKFLDDFNSAIEEQQQNFTFKQYTEVLQKIGFTLYITCDESQLLSSINDDNNNLLQKKEKEMLIIKDSWKVITKQKTIEENQSVDKNLLLLFCFTVLGLYKGETNPSQINETQDKKSEEENKVSSNMGTGKNFNSLHSQTKSKSKLNIQMMHKPNLIKQVLSQFDFKTYNYTHKISKQLRIFFKYFFDNRTNYILKKNSENRKKFYTKSQEKNEFTFKPQLGHRSIKSAEKYRMRKASLVSDEGIDNDSLDRMDRIRSRLKLEDVYDVLKKKKEL